MATNIPPPHQRGYDVAFTVDVPDELKCIICHLVLRNPVQIMACGHRFCDVCFQEMKDHVQHSNSPLVCPMDRELVSIAEVFSDRAACRTIGNMKVRCGNSDRGCAWVDDLRDLKVHEESCDYRVIDEQTNQMMSLNRGRGGETDGLIQDILKRMQKYDEDLVGRDKELAHAKFVVGELKQDSMLKDEEIQSLKIFNAEFRRENKWKLMEEELRSVKQINTELQKEIVEVRKSNDVMKKIVQDGSTKVEESESCLGEEISILQSKIDALKENNQSNYESQPISKLEKDIKTNRSHIDKSISRLEKEIQSVQSEVDKSIEKGKEGSLQHHVENIENLLFAHNSLSSKTIEFKWVMQDYQKMFKIGNPVYSPVFHTKVSGYSVQLYVGWSGEEREKLGLGLYLHRGTTPHKFLLKFNHEFSLQIHNNDGGCKSKRLLQEHINDMPQCFQILHGEDKAGAFGGDMLSAPFDDYIINNSLHISCIVYL